MRELQIHVLQRPGVIDTNFEELESQLQMQMQAYKELDVTESNIPERKADVATLRKIKKAIDDRRKDVKKTYNEPLAEFEEKVKRLTQIIDGQIDRINDGLQLYENKRREEKQALISRVYEENIGEYAEFLPLSKIQSAKWLNKTCSESEIASEIQEMTLGVQGDLNTIRALDSEIEEELIKAYKAAGNSVAAAVTRNADYQRAARVAAQKAAEKPRKEVVEEVPMPQQKPPTDKREPSMTVTVWGLDDMAALQLFLDMEGIKYEERLEGAIRWKG